MKLANIIWTFIIYFCTIGIVYVIFRMAAEERLEAARRQTQMLFQARRSDQDEIRPRIADVPTRTIKNVPFRLIR